MTIDDVTKMFKNGNRFEIETGMSHVSYHNWLRYGYIPILSQLKLEKVTNGALKADLAHIPEEKEHA